MNETTRADIAIIGTGPAGVSAAITARVRGKQVLLFGSKGLTTKMTKAHTIRNYPGLPDITGTDLADKLKHHLDVMGVEITEKQVTTVYAMGSYFGIQTPDIMYEASSVILAGGVVMGKPFPGEDELLGRGVSYCATCDAHFYKGKAVAVLGYNAESCREADFLAETCARVLYFPVVPHEVNVGPNVTVVRERVLSIPGTMRAEGVQTDLNLIMGAQGEIFETSDMYPAFIKKAQEELQTAFYAVAERIYKEQGAAAQQAEAAQTDVQGEGTNAAGGSDDNVVDADYTDAN